MGDGIEQEVLAIGQHPLAARRPWASRNELRSLPRAAAARSSRSQSSSEGRHCPGTMPRLFTGGIPPMTIAIKLGANQALALADAAERL